MFDIGRSVYHFLQHIYTFQQSVLQQCVSRWNIYIYIYIYILVDICDGAVECCLEVRTDTLCIILMQFCYVINKILQHNH